MSSVVNELISFLHSADAATINMLLCLWSTLSLSCHAIVLLLLLHCLLLLGPLRLSRKLLGRVSYLR